MTARPRVVVAASLPPAGLELLGLRYDLEAGSEPPERPWLLDHVRGAAGMVAAPRVRVDSELLDAAGGSLKVVANFGVGYDNIDVAAARERRALRYALARALATRISTNGSVSNRNRFVSSSSNQQPTTAA